MKQLLTFFICIISLTTGYSATAFTADIPYLSSYASGDYGIYPRTGGIASLSDLRKPIIVVEGYDYYGEYSGQRIFNIINYSGLASNLRQRGYDVVVLNFQNGGDYIQRNAFLLVKLIQLINSNKVNQAEKLVVIGYSMGGLVARYALTYMENHATEPNMEHQTRLYISYDSPQQGANIAMGIQALLNGIRSKLSIYSYLVPELQTRYDELQCPAAKQMLIYHINGYNGLEPGTVNSISEHTNFYTEIRALNDCNGYPKKCRNVALTLGSGSGSFQKGVDGNNMIPGAEAFYFYWNYTVQPWVSVGQGGFVSTMPGNYPGIPGDFPNDIYLYYTSGVINTYTVLNRNRQQPVDIVPGSFINIFEQTADGLSQTINTGNYESNLYAANACFIPSISALDLATDDYFLNISSYPNLNEITPFETTFHGFSENSSHMSPAQDANENTFVINQIEDYSNPQCYLLTTTLNLNNVTVNNSETKQEKKVGSITAQNYTIKNGANVSFEPTTLINLLPGFKAEAGSTFSAKIGCLPKPCVFSYGSSSLKKAILADNSVPYQNLDTSPIHAYEGINSIQSNSLEISSSVYPNPSPEGIYYLNCDIPENVLHMDIINAEGVIIKSYSSYSSKVDINSTSPGIYFLRVTTTNGSRTFKLIK